MPSAARQPLASPAEYLALERRAAFRSEYLDGHIVAMAGTSLRHNLIAGNLFGELRQQLRGGPCETYFSDVRLKVESTGLYTYPDVVVVCGEPRLEDAHHDTLLNPTLIVEVLSPSTEAYDRGAKFTHYRQLASLQEYVLVAQNKAQIERYQRRDTTWLFSDATRLEETIELTAIGCRITLADVYERVDFATDGEAEPLPEA